MFYRIALFALTMMCAGTISYAQDESVETFNAIKLEHSSYPGSGITLSAPSGVTPYYLLLPATTAPTGRRHAFSLNAGDGAMVWYATPLGSTGQLPYFSGDEELTGSPALLWDNTDQQLTISSTSNKPMLRLVKDASVTADEALISINATYSSPTGNVPVDINLIDFGFDGTALANGSSVNGLKIDIEHSSSNTVKPSKATGLRINVSGADTNHAAIITGGFVGVNTEYPAVYLDVAGDMALREYNYTGNLATTNDNVDFDGEGNRHSFIRVASATTDLVTIRGIAGGYDGKIIKLYNATGHGIKLENKASNNSANDIKSSAEADVLLLSGNTYELIYSGTEQNWLVAFSGPGELAQLGNKDVTVANANGDVLPSSVSSYIQIETNVPKNVNTVHVSLEDGTNPGQILVIQNKGPTKVSFDTDNAVWDNTSDLQEGESIILVWNGDNWVQVARASN